MSEKINFSSPRQLVDAKVKGISRVNGYRADLDLIFEEPGFNIRQYDDADVIEQIERYAQIYLQADAAYEASPKTAPNPGEVLGEFKVRVEPDGKLFLTDAHLRNRGARLAIQRGAKNLTWVPIKHDTSKCRAESYAQIQTSQDGLKLKPLEVAMNYARMIYEEKWTHEQVAKAVGHSEMHVRQNLELLSLPEELKDLIKKNRIAPNVARELVKQYGDDQAVRIAIMGDDLTQESGKKITPKVLDAAKSAIITGQAPTQQEAAPSTNGSEPDAGSTLPSGGVGESEQKKNAPPAVLARQPIKRLSQKLIQEMRERTLSVSSRLLSNAESINLDGLSDDDEIEVTLSVSKAELMQIRELQAKLNGTAEDGDKSPASNDNQLSLWKVPKWESFNYPKNQTEFADLQDRFGRLMESMGADEATRTAAWTWLTEEATEQELLNLRSMRAALEIAGFKKAD